MKLTKSKFKQIIKEEISKILTEGGMQDNPGLGPYSGGFERERAWIASYINAWFNQRAAGSGGSLVDALRKGAQGVPGDPWKADVSFNKALREDGVIAPEDVDHFANALENLANAIEADNTLVDPKKIGKKGDWYKYAQGPKEPPGNVPPGSETWAWDDWKAGSGLPWEPTIKEEATKQLNEWNGATEYTPEQQTVVDAMDSLTDLVYKMGRSDPEMTDTYIALLRALEKAGVSIKHLAMMV